MKHLDLFSGIGGFSLAVDEVWNNEENEHIFVEIDPFCQRVLRKHWPNAEIIGDIRNFPTHTKSRRWHNGLSDDKWEIKSEVNSSIYKTQRVDLLTGGFPCQPFSQAGRRKGTKDDRHLWPEMLRVIKQLYPTWVVAENVRGLLTIEQGLVFEQVCLDLEACGYETQTFIIPACAKNAPHRRDRVWFIAHCNDTRGGTPASKALTHRAQDSEERKDALGGADGQNSDAQDAFSERGGGRMESIGQILGSGQPETKDARPSWEKDWVEVAARLCGVDDGLPVELDGLKLSKSRHRAERLKSLGNSIVPQVAVEVMKCIKSSTSSLSKENVI